LQLQLFGPEPGFQALMEILDEPVAGVLAGAGHCCALPKPVEMLMPANYQLLTKRAPTSRPTLFKSFE
jgi:hypothetical protein